MPLRRRPLTTSALVTGLIVGAVAFGLGGCGRGDDASASVPAETNCGFPVTAEELAATSPQRVVTIKSSTAEMMLALGLGDLIVGSAFLDGPLPDDLRAAATGTAVAEPFTDGVPGLEATLALEPDLILAGWESNLTPSGVGSREQLAELGVGTWVPASACEDPANRVSPLTFSAVLEDIRQVGVIFGVEDAAEALAASLTEQWNAVTADPRGLTALWWSSGTLIPFVGGGDGAPQMIMDRLGLVNVAADLPERWTSFGWESVLAADPDVLVLVDSDWNTARAKIEFLEGDSALSQLTAVREGRYLWVPFAATEPGVRNAAAATWLAEQLTNLHFDQTNETGTGDDG